MTDSLEAAPARVDVSLRSAIMSWLADHPGEWTCHTITSNLRCSLPAWPWAGDPQQTVASECARAHRLGHLTRSRRRELDRLRPVYGLVQK
jgi:hypothetical protein